MEISKENAIAAYNAADDSGKAMLRALFPDMEWEHKRLVTERIKTFEDACAELGSKNALVREWFAVQDKVESHDLIAYLKLRIITAALNESWEPQFTEEEWRYYPWFYLWTEDELAEKSEEWKRDRYLTTMQYHRGEWAGFTFAASANASSDKIASSGSRLCFKSNTLAEYAGKQFIDLWMDFYLIRK